MTTEGDVQGMTWEQVESTILLAVYRESHMLYDNVGISASMSDMPSAKDKHEACQALYPRGRLACFLLRLQPKKKLRLRATYNFWDDRVNQERINYYLDKAVELISGET